MANATQPNAHADTTSNPEPTQQQAREMVVKMHTAWGFASIYGTRAQLEEEGIIPQDIKWPEGVDRVHWVAGKCRFRLSRHRPEGLKGPMKVWAHGDWWELFWMEANSDSQTRTIQRKKAELERELHKQSAPGRYESELQSRRFFRASCDKAFQAFKAKVPGLIPPKRTRKAAPAA
ncbi:hypothetical protein WG899_09475 [Paucibacter sp. AS339]|uniref:hypothetical protein n=1 Tax=Paucibacter hankyongi TaxID=3133434 RepID=UPI0030A8F54D